MAPSRIDRLGWRRGVDAPLIPILHHTYERLFADGLPYFVTGLGGASSYPFPTPPLPETKFRYNEQYGALLVNATKSSITYDFITVEGTKRDTLTVPSPAACAK